MLEMNKNMPSWQVRIPGINYIYLTLPIKEVTLYSLLVVFLV